MAVCESPEIDALILEEGTTPMAPIGGFGGAQLRQRPDTVIWVPVIGERAGRASSASTRSSVPAKPVPCSLGPPAIHAAVTASCSNIGRCSSRPSGSSPAT